MMPGMPQVLILAGGRGERLGPLTRTIPKPMVEVGGHPFLLHLLNLLRSHGLTEVILSVGYLHQKIIGCFGDGRRLGLHIHYSIEHTPLGTGGAVKLASPLLGDPFFLLNGDTYLPLDYRELHAMFLRLRKRGLIVAYENPDSGLDRNNILLREGRMVEYSKRGGSEMQHVDAGVGVFDKSVLNSLTDAGVCSFEETVFNRLISKGELGCYITQQRYYDIGTPERLRTFEEYLKKTLP